MTSGRTCGAWGLCSTGCYTVSFSFSFTSPHSTFQISLTVYLPLTCSCCNLGLRVHWPLHACSFSSHVNLFVPAGSPSMGRPMKKFIKSFGTKMWTTLHRPTTLTFCHFLSISLTISQTLTLYHSLSFTLSLSL
jgi:hypothetical protein